VSGGLFWRHVSPTRIPRDRPGTSSRGDVARSPAFCQSFPAARKTAILLSSIALCAFSHLAAAPAPDDSTARTSRWQEDLDFFARQLPARQIDFSQLMPGDKFERSVAELKREVPQLSDQDILFELMRIVAGLGVAHTGVAFGSIKDFNVRTYPVQMQWFSDGLAVVAATPEHQEALGCRVVRIGSLTPEQAEAAVAPYIPHENNAWLHAQSPRYLNLVELMQREKIADANGRLQLTLAKAGGGEFTLEIRPAGRGQSSRKMVKADDALPIPAGLKRKHPGASYWFEYLPDTQTLYLQYNKCANETNNPFTGFAKALFAFADAHPVQRVVVDLRFNAGGSSSIVKPLVEGLKSRPALNAQGHLYVLIGSQTFSSGVFAVMDFRTDLHALLVGEPTGNKPNHYGLQQNFALPNSRLMVHYSARHFRLMPDADPPTVEPDIMAPTSLADFLAGRDPALAAALRQPSQ
jgi:hypothetical protein